MFIANRPLAVKKLAEICGAGLDETSDALDRLSDRLSREESGVRLVRSGNDVQLATAPDNASMVQDFLKDETTGELTKPSLETLTIIAYRGPLTKPELEQIRGVNCSMILRNLLMRGLIEVQGDTQDLTAVYSVTVDFLKFLGVTEASDLPDYEKLRTHENIMRAMDRANGVKESDADDGGEANTEEAADEGPEEDGADGDADVESDESEEDTAESGADESDDDDDDDESDDDEDDDDEDSDEKE